MLDRNDKSSVYSWSLGVCRDAPLHALAERFKSDATSAAIIDAIGDAFPATTASDAVSGCKAGFEQRSEKAPTASGSDAD